MTYDLEVGVEKNFGSPKNHTAPKHKKNPPGLAMRDRKLMTQGVQIQHQIGFPPWQDFFMTSQKCPSQIPVKSKNKSKLTLVSMTKFRAFSGLRRLSTGQELFLGLLGCFLKKFEQKKNLGFEIEKVEEKKFRKFWL